MTSFILNGAKISVKYKFTCRHSFMIFSVTEASARSISRITQPSIADISIGFGITLRCKLTLIYIHLGVKLITHLSCIAYLHGVTFGCHDYFRIHIKKWENRIKNTLQFFRASPFRFQIFDHVKAAVFLKKQLTNITNHGIIKNINLKSSHKFTCKDS